MPIRVLLADDQAMVREGFAVLLDAQPDIEVVAQAADGREAVALTHELGPDVVVMDVRMPVLDGLAATRLISGRTKVIVLTTFDIDEYVFEALRAGASGFLLKQAGARELAEAVRTVAAGEALLAPSATRRLIAEFVRLGPRSTAAPCRAPGLSERETEVLVLIAQGRSNAEIAEQLVVSERTVKSHVSSILTKLGLRDRTQAAIYAFETGLVRPAGRPPGEPLPGGGRIGPAD